MYTYVYVNNKHIIVRATARGPDADKLAVASLRPPPRPREIARGAPGSHYIILC